MKLVWAFARFWLFESLRDSFPAACCIKPSALPNSVIPACLKRWFDWAHHRQIRNWTPDPFDVAQGRGEHSRTTIKTFGGDALGIILMKFFRSPHSLLRGSSFCFDLRGLFGISCFEFSVRLDVEWIIFAQSFHQVGLIGFVQRLGEFKQVVFLFDRFV